MNTQRILTQPSEWLGASLAAWLALTATVQAQAWQTLLPAPDFAPGWSGVPVLRDPLSPNPDQPTVYLGCWSDSPTGLGSVLRLEANGDSTYTPSVVDTELDRVYGLSRSLSDGALYAVGDGLRVTQPPFPRQNPTVWKVRRSHTGELNSWELDGDSFALSTKDYASARGVACDPDGRVFVVGTAGLNGTGHWIVRRSEGAGWTTVCDLTSRNGGLASGVCTLPGNGILPPALFVVGVLNSKWTVLRSYNQGDTWDIVDSWPPGTKTPATTASKVTADAAGNLYVVGSRGTFTYPTGWVVRVSLDRGTTWTTVLDASDGANSFAGSIATDLSGTVWVSGTTHDAAGLPRWTVLRKLPTPSPLQGWTEGWQARELPFGDTYSKARGIAPNPSGGDVFITGEVRWQDGTSRVALQRLLP